MDQAEKTARELTATIGTKISADDPIIALIIAVKKETDKAHQIIEALLETQAADNKNQYEKMTANQSDLLNALVGKLTAAMARRTKPRKERGLLGNNMILAVLAILIVINLAVTVLAATS